MKIKIEAKGIGTLVVAHARRFNAFTLAEAFAYNNERRIDFIIDGKVDGTHVYDYRISRITEWFVEECGEDVVVFDTRQKGDDVFIRLRQFAVRWIKESRPVKITMTKGRKEMLLVDANVVNIHELQTALAALDVVDVMQENEDKQTKAPYAKLYGVKEHLRDLMASGYTDPSFEQTLEAVQRELEKIWMVRASINDQIHACGENLRKLGFFNVD